MRDWLDKAGVEIRNAPEPELQFNYIVSLNSRKVRVYQERRDPQYICLQTIFMFTDHDNKIISCHQKGVSSLIRDLRIHLAMLGMHFSGISFPLEKVFISKKVLITDQFNEYEFSSALDRVEAAWVIFTEVVTGYGESPSSESK
ncbi:MAG: DUF2299 family protein [Bryobacterales bacterium]|nr:DUF2299 family protein [Bryobacterales bacterium]